MGVPGTRERLSNVSGYLSDAVKFAHASAVKASVPPSRSVVSRTMITALAPSLAVSTQFPPLLSL
jgi:hypothetical protein